MRSKIWFFVLISVLFTVGCQPDEWWPQGDGFSELDSIRLNQLLENKVFIMNEGLFNYNNASLSVYDEKSKSLEIDYYKNTTHQALGDVGQSMLLKDSLLFCVVNNSGKVALLDLKNNEFVAEVSGLTSPRFVYWSSDNSLLVSDLYANEISVLDGFSLQQKSSIALPGWSEHFFETERGTWVERRPIFSNPGLKFGLFLLNKSNDAFIDSTVLDVKEPSGIALVENTLWLLYSGNSTSKPYFINIDLSATPVNVSSPLVFGASNEAAGNLAYDRFNKRLVFDYQGISSFNLTAKEFHFSSISVETVDWYNIAVNPKNGEVYATDPQQFTGVGKVYRYAPTGELIDVFETGIIPSAIVFAP